MKEPIHYTTTINSTDMKKSKHYDIGNDMRYLQLLSNSFPTIAEASTEIINLQAILNLPKATEHFIADIHGEYEAFQHILKNASGNIKRKVNELFGTTLREIEKRELCTLIYYPEQKLELVKASEPDINDWYHITLHHLVAICRDVSSKYHKISLILYRSCCTNVPRIQIRRLTSTLLLIPLSLLAVPTTLSLLFQTSFSASLLTSCTYLVIFMTVDQAPIRL